MKIETKNYSDSFLYYYNSKNGENQYDKNLHKFLISSKVVDKKDPSFEIIINDIKRRQIHNSIVKLLEKDTVVLLYDKIELPRTFKVFTCKDIKSGDGKTKVFIDVSNVIIDDNGKYYIRPKDVDKFIAYLISAMTNLIYYTDATKLINNNSLLENGTVCFSKLLFYVIDYLRVGNVEKVKEKTIYLASLYYNIGILKKEGDSVYTRAIKISGLTKKEADVLELRIDPKMFDNINTFIKGLSDIIKADNLLINNFIERWIYLFGPKTIFATEIYPAFSTMLTDTYVGTYLNQQKTIEKICGKDFVTYSNELLSVGSELLL